MWPDLSNVSNMMIQELYTLPNRMNNFAHKLYLDFNLKIIFSQLWSSERFLKLNVIIDPQDYSLSLSQLSLKLFKYIITLFTTASFSWCIKMWFIIENVINGHKRWCKGKSANMIYNMLRICSSSIHNSKCFTQEANNIPSLRHTLIYLLCLYKI